MSFVSELAVLMFLRLLCVRPVYIMIITISTSSTPVFVDFEINTKVSPCFHIRPPVPPRLIGACFFSALFPLAVPTVDVPSCPESGSHSNPPQRQRNRSEPGGRAMTHQPGGYSSAVAHRTNINR